jgi:hypothetical protein
MARRRYTGGGNGLQIRKVATNILNKKSKAAKKGWSFGLRVGRGSNNSSPSKNLVIECYTGPGTST